MSEYFSCKNGQKVSIDDLYIGLEMKIYREGHYLEGKIIDIDRELSKAILEHHRSTSFYQKHGYWSSNSFHQPGFMVKLKDKSKHYIVFPCCMAICNHLNYEFNLCRQQNCIESLNKYKKELIEKTWHPDRVKEWCFDQATSSDIYE